MKRRRMSPRRFLRRLWHMVKPRPRRLPIGKPRLVQDEDGITYVQFRGTFSRNR